MDNDQIMRMMLPPILGFLVSRFFIQPDKEWNDEQEIKQVVTFIVRGLGA